MFFCDRPESDDDFICPPISLFLFLKLVQGFWGKTRGDQQVRPETTGVLKFCNPRFERSRRSTDQAMKRNSSRRTVHGESNAPARSQIEQHSSTCCATDVAISWTLAGKLASLSHTAVFSRVEKPEVSRRHTPRSPVVNVSQRFLAADRSLFSVPLSLPNPPRARGKRGMPPDAIVVRGSTATE